MLGILVPCVLVRSRLLLFYRPLRAHATPHYLHRAHIDDTRLHCTFLDDARHVLHTRQSCARTNQHPKRRNVYYTPPFFFPLSPSLSESGSETETETETETKGRCRVPACYGVHV